MLKIGMMNSSGSYCTLFEWHKGFGPFSASVVETVVAVKIHAQTLILVHTRMIYNGNKSTS